MIATMRGEFYEGAGIYLKARLSGGDNNLISSSSFTTAASGNINISVFDNTDLTSYASAGVSGTALPDTLVPVYTATPAYTGIIVPLTLNGWSEDLIGYNFTYTFTSQYAFQGGHSYRVEFKLNTINGAVYAVFELACRSTGS